MNTVAVPDEPHYHEIKRLLAEAQQRISQAIGLLVGEASSVPKLSAKEAARVEKVGEVAYRHLQFLEQRGLKVMTLGDSLKIRRELYGDKVQATANLFGRAGQNAILQRDTDYGEKVKYDQMIKLTPEGKRIANLWLELHPEAKHGDTPEPPA